MKINKKKVLITGGTGYLGSIVATNFLSKYNVYVIDNLSNSTNKFLNPKIKFHKIDISNSFLLNKYLQQQKFSTILHFAAKKSVIESNKNKKKYYNENVINTQNLCKMAFAHGLKNFIFISSAAVYGKVNKTNSKLTNLKPISFYGKTKLYAENFLQIYCKKNNIKLAILRLFNAAGAEIRSKLGNRSNKDLDLFNLLVHSIEKKKTFKLFGNKFKTRDGTCERNFIHIKDVANIVSKILKYLLRYKKNKLIINVCSEKSYSVLEVIKKFELFYRKKIDLKILNKRKGEILSSNSSYKFIKEKLNYRCRYSNLDNLVKSTINWYRYLNN